MRTIYVIVGIGCLLAISGCVTNSQITIFEYSVHDLPRVYVTHSPLNPSLNEEISFNVTAEIETDTELQNIGVHRMNANNEVVTELPCTVVGLTASCSTTSANDGAFFYRAFIRYNGNKRAFSPATYEFSIGQRSANDVSRYALRVPLPPNNDVDENFSIDVALVHDSSSAPYSLDDFRGDATRMINLGILKDPIYRWRDNQIAFYASNRPARTSSFYAGRDTACGQNPWPASEGLPEELIGMEVLGILHRSQETTQTGAAITQTSDYRDCAGLFIGDPDIGTFSSKMDLLVSPLIAKHEFGHAAFGLGDEYNESMATRNVTQSLNPIGNSCCCQCNQVGLEVDGGVEGGGFTSSCTNAVSDIRCVGGAPSLGGSLGLPICEDNFVDDDAWVPLSCLGAGQSRCPPLESTCVLDSAWLGSPPELIDYKRHNVFPDKNSCELAATQAADHPGVENKVQNSEQETDILLGECRQLCGSEDNPCPCGTVEAWITDTVTASDSKPHDDAMTNLDSATPLHGGTCAWCVETSLCIRWQGAHNSNFSPQEIWQTCKVPPKWLRHFNDFIEYLGCRWSGRC